MNSKQMEMMAREHDVSAIDPEFVEETAEAVAEAAVTGYKKIEKGVVDGYKKIETGVVEGYKKIETGIVEGFSKVTDKCVEVLFTREGETVEEAKERLRGETKERN